MRRHRLAVLAAAEVVGVVGVLQAYAPQDAALAVLAAAACLPGDEHVAHRLVSEVCFDTTMLAAMGGGRKAADGTASELQLAAASRARSTVLPVVVAALGASDTGGWAWLRLCLWRWRWLWL